jgi:hypothetical protein
MGAFGGGGVGGAAGMGQADLAAGGQGAAGLTWLLPEEAAALSGGQQPLVDLAVVQGAGGDEVVEVAGRFPQLTVALAYRGGGDSGQLFGEDRPCVTFTRAVGGGRSRTGLVGRWSRRDCNRSSNAVGTWPSRVSKSRPAIHW